MGEDLSELVKLGRNDDAECAAKVKELFDGVSCQDLASLLACQTSNPQVFTSYLKLMKYLNEMRQDCSELQAQIFGDDDKDGAAAVPPDWVKHCIRRKPTNDGAKDVSDNAVNDDKDWNKVMIMDPPTL